MSATMSAPAITTDLLAQADLEYLEQKGYLFSVSQSDGFINVVRRGYVLPPACMPKETDPLVRLPPNFLMAKPDMFWAYPYVKPTATGGFPPASATFDVRYEGRPWQRWSRHFETKLWRPGVDNLGTYLGMIRRELQKGLWCAIP